MGKKKNEAPGSPQARKAQSKKSEKELASSDSDLKKSDIKTEVMTSSNPGGDLSATGILASSGGGSQPSSPRRRRNWGGGRRGQKDAAVTSSSPPAVARNVKLPAALPVWEKWLCVAAWCGSAAYSCYGVYRVSIDSEEHLNDYDFTQGWSFLGRKKDISNFEWDFWSGWLSEVYPWYAGNILLGQLLRWVGFKFRGPVFVAYCFVALWYIMQLKMVGVLLVHCLCAYLAAWIGSIVFIWVICILLLATLNYDPFSSWMKLACDNDPFERKYYLLVFTLAMTNLRYISFCVEWCEHRKRVKRECNTAQELGPQPNRGPDISFTPMDMMIYCFYFPLFMCGPVLTYNKFYEQFYRPLREWTWGLLLPILRDLARVAFWAMVCELILHFFYFNSIQHNSRLMETIPLWALAGVGYCHGQFFMVKYVVMFGFPQNVARFDQLEPPLGPKCISRIYKYSEMWKYFDRGLHSFMKRHIYIPLGGSQHGLAWQTLASAACFTFVYFWHGAEDYLFLWTFLNFIGISLEMLGSWAVRSLIPEKSRWLSPAMRRRLEGVLAVPLFTMYILAIFTFFGGKQIGNIFFQRLIWEGWPVPIFTIYIFLYCVIQTSIEVQRWELRKRKLE